MKKIKSLLPMLALFAALTTAFVTKGNSAATNVRLQSEEWVFLGTANDDESDQTLYGKSSEHPGTSCGGEQNVICKIIANEDGVSGYPDLNGMSPRNEVFSPTYRPE
jgi:hypothetical protein